MTKCKFPIQRLAALCILVASPLAAASDPTVAADAMADDASAAARTHPGIMAWLLSDTQKA